MSRFLLVAMSCALAAIPIAYSVSNFGTLFRLRLTPAVELAILPMLAWHRRRP